MLRVGFACIAWLIRDSKMCKDTFGVKPRKRAALTDTFHTSIKIIPVAQISQTGHSSVNLDMNLHCATAFHGFFAVFKCLCFTGDSLCDVVLNQAADLLLWRMSKNQNRHGNVI